MNFSCIFVLAVALFGAFSEGYLYSGVGYNGVCGTGATVGNVGAGYAPAYGPSVGVGYGVDYESGYGGAVADTCQCVKTIVRPSTIERIPYTCTRTRVQPTVRAGYGVYPGTLYGRTSGLIGTGPVGTGVIGTGPVGTGVIGTGPVGTGVIGTGPVGTAVIGTGTVGAAAVGAGYVGTNTGYINGGYGVV